MTTTDTTTREDAHAPPGTVELTMLNVMGGADFDASVARHRELGLRWMDLKDSIYGKDLKDLSLEDARRVAKTLEANGLETYCFSTVLLGGDLTAGEEAFAGQDLADLEHILALAEVLRPRFVRLLAAQLSGRGPGEDAIDRIERDHPWVIPAYRQAIDRIVATGFEATIENEAWSCMLSTTAEFRRFFAALDRGGAVSLTWDAQNQWATGVMPTLDVYEELRYLIAYYHVKGGKTEGDDSALAWNVALDETTWPVNEVTQKIVDDGVSRVICLNPPSHGRPIEGYPYGDAVTQRDLAFLRDRVKGVA
jgi:sugar phosphate isomerase/epimerase